MAKVTKPTSQAAEAVVAAQLAVAARAEEFQAAQDAADIAKLALDDARQVLDRCRVAADAELPQCRMVSVRWRTGTESCGGAVVIVKQTPSGMLVVRHIGENGREYRFKWSEVRREFVQAEAVPSFSNMRKLRDVPPEFLPGAEQQS